MKILITAISLLICVAMPAQEISLDEAITRARTQSVGAVAARADFISSYWAWRSYQASRLPSVYLYGDFMSFDRSIRQYQNYETGKMGYVETYNLQNSLGLALQQNITATGGTLRLYSDLNRIDEFGDNTGKTWYTQPLSLSYSQPLLSYNAFKWRKKISPKEYEKAKRVYLEKLEALTSSAVEAYYALMTASKEYEAAVTNYANTSRMFKIAGERMKIGTVTMEDYLQLELRMLTDSTSINDAEINMREAQMTLNSLLGFDGTAELMPQWDETLPDVSMDFDQVLDLSMRNSSFRIGNEISILNADAAIAQARAQRGATASINAKFGLNNSAESFGKAYRNLMDQEVVGLSFSIPIFDWGMGRGRVKEAEAKADVVRAQVEQAEADYVRSIFTAVGQFNKQRDQCELSRRAREISERRNALMMEKFRSGSVSVTELITSQNEKDAAIRKQVDDLGNYWKYYYALRKLTLHDFIAGQDIDVDYEEITGYED